MPQHPELRGFERSLFLKKKIWKLQTVFRQLKGHNLLMYIWLRGATVARLTPDQKAACSNHVGVIKFLSLSYLKKKIFVLITNKHSVWCVTAVIIQKYICLQWGLNSWPLVYKTNALPLSYRGFHGYKCKSGENLNAAVMWMILLPGTNIMNGSMV